MAKFFTDNIKEGVARLQEEDVRHAQKVLRLALGDEVEINDLQGRDYMGTVIHLDRQEVQVRLGDPMPSRESPLEITVFQALPKGQKMDLVCQKLSELGARRLVPTITHRVVPALAKEYKKLDRLRRISLEAGKQAGRSLLMEVTEPIKLQDMASMLEQLDLILLPYEEAKGRGIHGLSEDIGKARRIGVVIGPEGGFEAHEVDWLKESGAQVITLGPRILRTETCGLAVVSILQYLAGDMGGDR